MKTHKPPVQSEITVAEAATITGYSAQLIRRYVRDGRIKSRRVGQRLWLLDRESVLQFEPNPVGNPNFQSKMKPGK